eukprot:TRINITY_DN13813_c0_g1_i1.p2 TRINITY_DN13813_c0_g1~~TRINITY_DN13813_c0_g1_i1.p2  ORF type:complete len:176 (+),score=29.65 TRINITY_DN13813_c0_g1_i1:221-748(+)
MVQTMVLGVVLLLAAVTADLPSHCLWSQVAGDWRFHLSSASHAKGVKCSDVAREDGAKHENYGLGEPTYEVDRTMEVRLEQPNVAIDIGSGERTRGTWTMIYDEGFEVRIGGRKFFAFSRFSHDARTGQTTSECHRTFPGWFHDAADPDTANWGCYHGAKTVSYTHLTLPTKRIV